MTKYLLMTLAVVLVLGLAGFGVVATRGAADPPATPPRDFTAKIVLLSHKEGDTVAYTALEKVQTKRLEERTFFVGKMVGGSIPWKRGTTVWVPTHEVMQIVEFDNADELGGVVRLSQ